MRGIERSSRRFLLQNLLLLALMGVLAFSGVYISGRSAYRSANELGAMTADYLNLQVDAFMGQYQQILEDAAYMVDAMMEQGAAAEDVQQWITAFSLQYEETMQYDESGIYGVIRGEGVYSSGWRPGPEYNILERPWYLQAVEAGGACARSMVYEDARTGTRMVSLSKLLEDGESVLALDIRVGEIEVEWERGSDVYPGTATIVDQTGNVLLHQQIGREHISCELDGFTPQDYLDLMARFEGDRGMLRWDGETDSYQHYYITGVDGWTCIVTIPRSVITQDATNIFCLQLALQGIFLLFLLYLFIRAYLADRRNRRAVNCFEALGQTYFCVVLVDVERESCEVTRMEDGTGGHGRGVHAYGRFLEQVRSSMVREGDWSGFLEQFSPEQLRGLGNGASARRFLEYERVFPQGPRWVSAEAFAVPGEERQVILAFRLIHDSKIEELAKSRMLRESLDSARIANQAKSDFLSRMSHDMRTPMNAVIGFAKLAQSSLDQPEKAADCLDKVTAASQQLLHLINEVLDTAKIEQGKMELHLAPVDLVRQMEETADLFRLQARAQHQQFTLRPLNLRHRQVITDGSRLDQILNNLLSNAVKYTPAGGSIILEAEELEEGLPGQAVFRFTVSDTGIGMAPEFLERIFQPFEREDTSMTGTTSGVGLGMAIAQSIVQMLGGQIQVESRQGEGSRFTVTIPCALPEETAPVREGRQAAEADLTGRRLLLAEDNLLNQEIALELLGMEGAQVTAVENGREAVETFAASAPGEFEAILMDIQMPELDGYGAAREIRRLNRPDAAAIPILAMTANAFEDDVAAARSAGMNGHIAKPVDMGRIKEALAAVLPPR